MNLPEDLNYSTRTGPMKRTRWAQLRHIYPKFLDCAVIFLLHFWMEVKSRSFISTLKVSIINSFLPNLS